jgi:ribonuclease VapC
MKVFDTSAVLAILYGEQGGDIAQAALPAGRIAMANVTEAISDLLIGGHGSLEKCVETMRALGLHWVDTDESQALKAAAMKPLKGLSLGDRLCIALAQSLSAPVVTSDQAWSRHPLGVRLEYIR